MENKCFVDDFESSTVKEVVAHVLHNAQNIYDALVMYKFSKDDIYTHVTWYLMGAKDVLIMDDTVSNNDFKAARDIFNDFLETVKKKIYYNDFLED